MKLLQFAVASIVDANTGQGLAHEVNHYGYAASARNGRVIRAKSIAALYRQIKVRVGNAISGYREHANRQRQNAALAKLDDRLLKDIGLSREDIYALQSGAVSIKQVEATRFNHHQSRVLETTRVDPQALQLDAANETLYAGAKCA